MTKLVRKLDKERYVALLAPLVAGLYLSCQQTKEYYENEGMPLETAFFESYQKAMKAQFEEAGIEVESLLT